MTNGELVFELVKTRMTLERKANSDPSNLAVIDEFEQAIDKEKAAKGCDFTTWDNEPLSKLSAVAAEIVGLLMPIVVAELLNSKIKAAEIEQLKEMMKSDTGGKVH